MHNSVIKQTVAKERGSNFCVDISEVEQEVLTVTTKWQQQPENDSVISLTSPAMERATWLGRSVFHLRPNAGATTTSQWVHRRFEEAGVQASAQVCEYFVLVGHTLRT